MCYARILPLLLIFLFAPSALLATDLVAEKALLTQGPVMVGDTVRYVITVRNDKIPFAIDTSVNLFERWTSGLEWVDLQGEIGPEGCISDPRGGGFDCTFDIAAQEVKSAVVTFIATEVGVQGNAFSVVQTSGQEIDPTDNESPLVTIRVTALEITKRGYTVEGTENHIPGTYFYVITVTNTGDEAVDNLTVEDTLPLDQLDPKGTTVNVNLENSIAIDYDCFVDTSSDIAGFFQCDPFSLSANSKRDIVVKMRSTKPRELNQTICNTAILKQGADNIGSATFCAPVVKRYVPREDAIQTVIAAAVILDAFLDAATIHTSEEPVPAGSEACDANGESCMVVDEPVWVSFIDPDPYALFAHETYWATVPAGTDQEDTPPATTYPSGDLPPIINIADGDGTTTTTTSAASLPVVINPAPAAIVLPEVETDNSTPPPMARVCALLVTGYPNPLKQTEALSFQATASVMQQYLTAQPRGPRLPAANVERLNNPTAQEVEERLNQLQGLCDVLYFYYYGHGKTGGIFLKSDNDPTKYKQLGYAELAQYIYSVGAVENTVVLDNCFAGAAIPIFKADPNYKSSSLTLLTGASADKEGYQVWKTSVPGVLVSFYTGGLTFAANTDLADTDKDMKVSLKEAHTLLRRANLKGHRVKVNPGTPQERIEERGINDAQDPQLLENEVQPNDGQSIFIFEGSDVTVTVGSGKQTGTSAIDAIRVEEVIPRGGIEPNDPDLIELADGRHRTVEVIESGDLGFVIDIAFKMNAVLDSLTTTEIPGLAFRTDDTGSWTPQTATAWNPADSTVTVTGITQNGDWAYALTSGASAVSVEETHPPHTFTLHGNYPNPFYPTTTIRFDLPEPARVHLEVFDLLGRSVLHLAPGRIAAGTGLPLYVDASALTSGIYLYRLRADAPTRSWTTTGRFVLLK